MPELKICRICLQTGTKMYKFNRFQLLKYYEEIMTKKVNKKDGLPHYFCYECATLLHKHHKFKDKCRRGQKMLKEILSKGPITYKRIGEVDRKESNLISTLDIMKVSKKVKTYTSESTIHMDTDEDDDNDNYTRDSNDDSDSIQQDDFTEKEIPMEFNDTFPKYEEPEIFVDTLNHSDDKPLSEVLNELKPDIDDEKAPTDNDDFDMEPSTSIFVEEKKDILKIEPEGNEIEDSKAKTKTHNFKMPTKFLDPKHWKKVVLSEEEAMRQFKARAQDQKYLSWPFKCLDCLKGFSKEDILVRHRLIRHTETLPLECRFCRSRFKWNNFLRKHMRQHFTKYECLRCNIVCPLESTAIFHDDYHNGVVKKCIHCDLEFTHMTTYYSHLRTHRSEHICTLCGISFVSPAGLKRHKKMKHIEDEMKTADGKEGKTDTDTFCDKCNIQFETKQAYDVHLLHSAMHLDGLEDDMREKTSVQRSIMGVDDDDIAKGGVRNNSHLPSGAPFKYARKTRTRARMGISKKPMDCYQCGKHFESQSACMRHHLAEHPRTPFHAHMERHICEICGASLAPGSVPQHMNMHTREKMYPCDTCGRAFYASISLKRHLLTHTGEKPFGCTLCDKKFTQSNAMQLHFRTIHLKQPYPKRNRRKKEKAEELKTDESEEST